MLPGLADSVLDSQRIFRAALEVMARPGRVREIPGPQEVPGPLHPATAALCLALADFETPLWLDQAAAAPAVVEYLRFHCACPIVRDPAAARFALIADPGAIPPLAAFEAGSDENPDRSATLLVQVQGLVSGQGRRLAGPGIQRAAYIDARGLPERFWPEFRLNQARFPRGVDVILAAGALAAGLPRAVRVEG